MSTSKRPKKPFALQERDLALLRDLFECRIMTSAHVAALHFGGRREAAKKRLQTLKSAGLVGERARRAYEPSVLSLSKGGLTLLSERGILAEYPALGLPALQRRADVSELTVRHELEVMDVKAALHAALRGSKGLSIAEFSTWPRLNQFEARPAGGGAEAVVRPDGFVRLHEVEADGGLSEHCLFLEVDRSSETQSALVAKAHSYLEYYRGGGFAEKHGAPRSAFREYPFRLLMVFKTAERRNNMAESLLRSDPPVLTQALLSTIDEVRRDPLGSIWIRPLDYRDATRGTPFEPERQAAHRGYRRQPARESLVEARAKRHSIISP